MLERRQWSLSSCHFLLSSSAVFHQKPSLHCFCFPRYPTNSTEASHPNLSTYATWHLKEALACRSSLNQRPGRIGFCSVYRTPNDAVKWPRERSRTEGSLRCTWVLHWEAAKTFSRGGGETRRAASSRYSGESLQFSQLSWLCDPDFPFQCFVNGRAEKTIQP